MPLELVRNVTFYAVVNDMQQLGRSFQQVEFHADREFFAALGRHRETANRAAAREAIPVELDAVNHGCYRKRKRIRIDHIETEQKRLARKIRVCHLHFRQAYLGRIDQGIRAGACSQCARCQ